jgi:hypothetical protein
MAKYENKSKHVPLPDHVQVSVADLLKLREDSAKLAALEKAGVKDWQGYRYAIYLCDNDPEISDIRLGWKKRK